MIPEELENNEAVQNLTQEYTEGEIKFGEFKERLDFISKNGYDKEDKQGRTIRDEIAKQVEEYEYDNHPSGREYIVVNHEQHKKLVNTKEFAMQAISPEEDMELFGYLVKIDMNASNTPKIVESDKYEYEPECEKPIFNGSKMF